MHAAGGAGEPVSILTTDPADWAAVLSPCQRYRYSLMRRWAAGDRFVLWIMLNPSTADGVTNDATIRRCMRYSKDWGYDGLLVANLYALRATHPGDLSVADIDPVGPENDAHIEVLARRAAITVCAWGQPGPIPQRRWDVLRLLRAAAGQWPGLHYLTMNMNGEPGHPLRLLATLKPTKWDPVQEARAAGPGHGT